MQFAGAVIQASHPWLHDLGSLAIGATMNADVVISLAILKVIWDQRGGLLENFAPFVIDCLKSAGRPEVSLVEVHTCLAARFGLKVPLGPLKTLLRRLVRRDLLKAQEGVYLCNPAQLPDAGLVAKRKKALAKYGDLVRGFVEFCKARFDKEIDELEAKALLSELIESWALPILKGSMVDSAVETFTDIALRYPAQAHIKQAPRARRLSSTS